MKDEKEAERQVCVRHGGQIAHIISHPRNG